MEPRDATAIERCDSGLRNGTFRSADMTVNTNTPLRLAHPSAQLSIRSKSNVTESLLSQVPLEITRALIAITSRDNSAPASPRQCLRRRFLASDSINLHAERLPSPHSRLRSFAVPRLLVGLSEPSASTVNRTGARFWPFHIQS